MDLNSLLGLISNTAVDRMQATAVFESATGASLRADLSITDRVFRAIFQNGGDVLVITPGNVLALTPPSSLSQAPTSTQSALDAWKSQPPVTLAPLASGLQQLTTGNPPIDSLLQQLANSGGQLAVGIIPTLCWTDARYQIVELPAVRLTDVTGRVCFHDILINATELSFGVSLEVACTRAEVALGGADVLDLLDINLRLEGSVRYAFPTDEIIGELKFLSLRAGSGQGQVQGIGVQNFGAAVEARNVRLEKGQLTDGTVALILSPAQAGQPISVALPSTFETTDVTLGNVRDGRFQSLAGHLRLLDATKRTGAVELRNGRVRLDVMGIKLGAAGGPIPEVKPPGGTTFDVEVRQFRQTLAPDGATDRRFSLCLANPGTVSPALRLTFGSFTVQIDAIQQVKANAWNVGEFDTRVGLGLEKANGSLQGPGLPAGAVQIVSATLRLISDEYGPCAALPQVARRHAYAQFDLQLAGFPKRLVNEPFRSGEIPISPSALFHFLGNQVDSGVLKFIIDFVGRGFAIAGVIDIEVYLVFHGAFTVDFDPTQSDSSRNLLVFNVQLTVQMDVIVRVFGEIGICPVCLRGQIGDDITAPDLPLIAPSLTLEIEWEFDPATNNVRIRRAAARNPSDLIAAVAEVVANIYLQKAVVGRSIPLPPEFQVRGVRAEVGTAADDTVQIVLAVTAEKLDWA